MNENNLHDNDTSSEGSEHSEHPKPRYDDVNIPVIVMLGALSAIMTFVAICFVQGLYYQWNDMTQQADWNDRNLTPQEQVIVDQTKIRDGFYETSDGKIYVSVDVGAEKLIAAKGDFSEIVVPPEQPAESQKDVPEKKSPPKQSTPRPEPPGPGPEIEDPAKEIPASKQDK